MVVPEVVVSSVPRSIIVGIEVVPLGIHIVYLLFRGWFHRALSIRVISLVEVTPQHLGRCRIGEYP